MNFNYLKIVLSFVVVLGIWTLPTFDKSISASAPHVVIDPGHGGKDPGAIGFLYGKTYEEADLNMQISNKIYSYLTSYGVKVTMTRTNDRYLSLEERANFANGLNADVFLSVHHDANSSKSANGISTHYSTYRPNLNMGGDAYVKNVSTGRTYPYVKETRNPSMFWYRASNGSTYSISMNNAIAYDDKTPLPVAKKSKELSLKIANSLASLGYNRMYTSTGSKDHNLYVTRHTNMTSVLMENGFVSNPTELAKISNPTIQNKTAKLVAEDILSSLSIASSAEMTSVSTDKSSPQQENDSIKITASSKGSSNPQYKFNIYDGKNWIVAQGYSSKSSFSWRPTKAGKYKISVHVKDAGSNKNYDSYKAFEYEIVEEVHMTSVGMDKQSPQIQNKTIQFNASATGGKTLMYKYNVYDGKEWKVVRDYSTNSQFNWSPPKEGNYKISVHVKDSNSTNSYDSYKAFYYKVLSPIKINSLDFSKSTPQLINTDIKLTVNATGGSEKQYKFWVYDGKEWISITEYQSDNSTVWKPSKPGNYKISVHVKDNTSNDEYDEHIWSYFEIKTRIDLTASKVSPQDVYSTVRLTGVNVENAEYKFSYILNGNEKVIRDYSKVNYVDWIPILSGNYKLKLYKKIGGTIVTDEINYTINPVPLKINNIIVSHTSPQYINETITLNVNANGGENRQFKFSVYDGEKWTVLKDYGKEEVLTWTPTKPGYYKFSIHGKNENSNRAYDTYSIMYYRVLTKPVVATNLSTDHQSPQLEGQTIKLTANATGGYEKLYKFHVFDGKEWKVLRDYSTSNELNWKPKDGNYKLVVHVKDRLSSNEYDSYKAIYYNIKDNPVVFNRVELNHTSPQAANTTVNLKAVATGGSSKLYKFHIFDGENWKVLKDYSTSNEYNWIPKTVGEYKISVHVKDSQSKKAYDDYEAFFYEIVDGVSMTQVTHNYDKTTGEITIKADATGGTERQYKYWVLPPNETEWVVLNDYSTNDTFKWLPTEVGEYKFSIHVKDRHSSKDYDDFEAFYFRTE
ncbi:triple tyrosine motif-containing protein [Gracilibacillus marinus]|uniref:Triple tyrosine motif-containing protein n=1 Tax=Gracilibacillus marinus TaxID=630535 RepID=A0ABV8VSP0_9BACI